MKFSIRSKFSTGMVFLIIILALSIYSAYYMNKASRESGIILKENYLSLVYARDMTNSLTNINQEIIRSFTLSRNSDSRILEDELKTVGYSFQAEKNNITEPGEGKLVEGIEAELKVYGDSVLKYADSPHNPPTLLFLQTKYESLCQQLMQLSQMNGKAIEIKTDHTKISSQEAMTQMSVIATLCFIVALFYSYSFSSYSGERFKQLYEGVKKLGSGNYGHRLDFDGTDQFYELSLVINGMAEKLNEREVQMNVNSPVEPEKYQMENDLEELKNGLLRIKNLETEVEGLIARFQKKNILM